MKRKLIALATADWHLHEFQAFNKNYSRLLYGVQAGIWMAMKAHAYNIPILFSGDMYHNPKELTQMTLGTSLLVYHDSIEKRKVKVIGISGNHDLSEKNTLENHSPSYMGMYQIFENFTLLDRKSFEYKEVLYQGIPYMDNDKHFAYWVEEHRKKAKAYLDQGLRILMIHTNLPGAKTPEGFEIPDMDHIPRHIDNYFKDWDLVLCGHIHKPQILGNRRIIMLGNPIHQNQGDKGQRGFWYIYSDGTYKFKSLNRFFPCFVKEGEPHKDEDYIVPKIIEEIWQEEEKAGGFDVRHSSDKLTERYLKKKGIKDKVKRHALINILNEVR